MSQVGSYFCAFLHNKENKVFQAVKYVFCGGISIVVDQVTFYLFAVFFLPCLRMSDPVARALWALGARIKEVSEEELSRNFLITKIICFITSNAAVYILNVLFVFKTGRHKKHFEVLIFFGTSLFQLLFIWLGKVLIVQFGWEVTYSNITMLFVAMIVNFAVRKNMVFKG